MLGALLCLAVLVTCGFFTDYRTRSQHATRQHGSAGVSKWLPRRMGLAWSGLPPLSSTGYYVFPDVRPTAPFQVCAGRCNDIRCCC